MLGALLILFALEAGIGQAQAKVQLGFTDAFVHEDKWAEAEQWAGASAPDMLAEAGAKWVRIPWVWNLEHPYPVIGAAHAAGFRTVLTPYSYAHNADTPAFYRLLRDLADRYPHSPIEVLNEPNGKYGDYSPTGYAAILRHSVHAIERVNHRQHVIAAAGSFAPCGLAHWARSVANKTRHLHYAVALHVYLGNCRQMRPWHAAHLALHKVRSAMPGRRVWVTELGESAGIKAQLGLLENSDERQAGVLQGFVSALVRGHVDRLFVHRLYDKPWPETWSDPWNAYWGLHRCYSLSDPDCAPTLGEWKPALAAVRNALR